MGRIALDRDTSKGNPSKAYPVVKECSYVRKFVNIIVFFRVATWDSKALNTRPTWMQSTLCWAAFAFHIASSEPLDWSGCRSKWLLPGRHYWSCAMRLWSRQSPPRLGGGQRDTLDYQTATLFLDFLQVANTPWFLWWLRHSWYIMIRIVVTHQVHAFLAVFFVSSSCYQRCLIDHRYCILVSFEGSMHTISSEIQPKSSECSQLAFECNLTQTILSVLHRSADCAQGCDETRLFGSYTMWWNVYILTRHKVFQGNLV